MPPEMKETNDCHPYSKPNMIAHQLIVERHYQLVINLYDHQDSYQAGGQKGNQQQGIPELTMVCLAEYTYP